MEQNRDAGKQGTRLGPRTSCERSPTGRFTPAIFFFSCVSQRILVAGVELNSYDEEAFPVHKGQFKVDKVG